VWNAVAAEGDLWAAAEAAAAAARPVSQQPSCCTLSWLPRFSYFLLRKKRKEFANV
jgi:hypothetical protein